MTHSHIDMTHSDILLPFWRIDGKLAHLSRLTWIDRTFAAVAELAYAPGLEPGGRKAMGVQVPPAAQGIRHKPQHEGQTQKSK